MTAYHLTKEDNIMKNGKLQVAIVGCGGIANQKHFPSLKSQSDKCEMVAFCDIIVERAEKAAKEYGTPRRQSVRRLP